MAQVAESKSRMRFKAQRKHYLDDTQQNLAWEIVELGEDGALLRYDCDDQSSKRMLDNAKGGASYFASLLKPFPSMFHGIMQRLA